MRSNKTRLDQLLLDKKLIQSRSQARALILAGAVLVNEERIDKPGTLIPSDAVLRLKEKSKYVSRGGVKLERALKEFAVNVAGKICLDVGISTGGFTDCLLQAGAKKVFGVDVGYGQLHWQLQKDPRVVHFDRENFRHFDLTKITAPIDLVVMDVSFISIQLLLPKVVALFQSQTQPEQKQFIALIKPQFEAGPQNVQKGGIVKDEAVRQTVVEDTVTCLQKAGFQDIQVTPSPITGADGNVEYLVFGRK